MFTSRRRGKWRRVFRHVDQCKIRCSTAAPSHAEIIPGYDDGEAVSVNEIVFRAFNDYEGGDLSTNRMYLALPNNKKLAKVTSPIKGDIVMSPTGYGNGYVSNGHVGRSRHLSPSLLPTVHTAF
jgi:hypothetical protein